MKFNYTVEYSNQNGSIVFQTNTSENAYSVETPIQAQKKTIHGYVWNLADSGTTPETYNFNGTSVPIGTFNGSGGQFEGNAGAGSTVRYRYRVNYWCNHIGNGTPSDCGSGAVVSDRSDQRPLSGVRRFVRFGDENRPSVCGCADWMSGERQTMPMEKSGRAHQSFDGSFSTRA